MHCDTIRIFFYDPVDEFIPDGEETLMAWEQLHGPLPDTEYIEFDCGDFGINHALTYSVKNARITIPGIHACGVNISSYEDGLDDDVAKADKNVLGFIEYVRQRVVEWLMKKLHTYELMGRAAFGRYDTDEPEEIEPEEIEAEPAALIEA